MKRLGHLLVYMGSAYLIGQVAGHLLQRRATRILASVAYRPYSAT